MRRSETKRVNLLELGIELGKELAPLSGYWSGKVTASWKAGQRAVELV
jgi:hypothetical protein